MLRLTLLFFFLLPTSLFAAEGIAVVVNDRVISTIDVRGRLQLAVVSSGLPQEEQVTQKLLPQIIRLLIDEQLYIEDAETQNIRVSEEELTAGIQSLEQKNNLEPGSFPQFLKERGLSLHAMRNKLKAQITWNKILARKIRPRILISEQEIQEKIEHLALHDGSTEYHLSEIILPVDQAEDEAKIKALANNIVAELAKGAEFGLVAREFSRAASAASGGMIGWVEESQLDPEMKETIHTLNNEEISQPMRTSTGYTIIRRNNNRTIKAMPAGETEIGLKQLYIPFSSEDEKGKTSTINQLAKESDNINSCTEFENLAKDIGSTTSADTLTTKLKDLNQDIQNVVKVLPLGKPSQIVESDAGLYLFMVCERIEAKDNLAQKAAIKDHLLQQKLELESKRYLRELKRNAFIEVKI